MGNICIQKKNTQMPENIPSDEQLVEQSLANNQHFEKLVNRYEQKLTRYIRRFTDNQAFLEDILQEVFLKTYRYLNNFDTSLKFSSWIYRIAHNEAINFLQKNKISETISLDGDDEKKLIDIIPDRTDLPTEINKKETKETVHKVLKTLPVQYMEVLILKFIEEKSYEEISDILKKPSGTIATLINRAKTQFKNNFIKLTSHKS
jgi:RNA polymerase sigma-70 factor (ECF subfamily)